MTARSCVSERRTAQSRCLLDGAKRAAAPIDLKFAPQAARQRSRRFLRGRSLGRRVTASARGRSHTLADPGTCRAVSAASLGEPDPPVGCSRCQQSLRSFFAALMPGAAADPCAALRGGLLRLAASGRGAR